MLANAIDVLEECVKTAGDDCCKLPQICIEARSRNADWVEILIRDNGPGIPKDVQKKLFDPFFTTKPVGKGTGLGLSISYQIVVEQHGGELSCDSIPGEGAEFTIAIPVRDLHAVQENSPAPKLLPTTNSMAGKKRA